MTNEWIPNPGTEVNPVREGETLVALRFRNGTEQSDDGRNWHWSKIGGTFDITHYQVSPPRVAEPATMSADEVLIRAREAVIEAYRWQGLFAAIQMRRGDDDNMSIIRAILTYERDRAKPLAEVAPHTAEDPDDRAAYDLCVKEFGPIYSFADRKSSPPYHYIRAAIKRGRELERTASLSDKEI